MSKKKNIGSSFESFLDEEGIKDKATEAARRKLAPGMMSCGHHVSNVVPSGDGTCYCGACAREAEEAEECDDRDFEKKTV
ncbi:MAG: hypothetical protein DRJ03_29755, partial [Chloroflexi bacterium]